MERAIASILTLVLVGAGCAGPGPVSTEMSPPFTAATPSRTLVVIARDIPTLAATPLQGVSGSARQHIGLFNSALTGLDEGGSRAPLLAEALPRLHSESWRIFPDGRMETIYRLRPGLSWHDGTPFTADDFVFAWQVYATPDFGTTGPPAGMMEEVQAVDPRTVLIRWRVPYPQAGELGADFAPLPRHILEQSFRALDPLGFVALPFWVAEYVGLGPYRVERYEPGAWIDASAFDGYVLGRPRIDRLQVSFILDPSTAVAHLLAGEAHYVTDYIIGPDDAISLERQWQSRGQQGTTLYMPSQIRFTSFQFRSEVMNPADMGDVRVRKAIAHSIDNEASLEAVTYGKGKIVSVPAPDDETFWYLFDGFPRHGYDPKRAQQLLEEAGYARGDDGRFRSPNGRTFEFEFGYISQASNERENAIWVDNLRQVGLAAHAQAYVQAQVRGEGRSSFPALFTGSGTRLTSLGLDDIPMAQNRWQGNNYGAWRNEDYTRLDRAFETTLELERRNQILLDMGRIYYEQLPGIAHYLTPIVNAWSPNLANVPSRSAFPRVNPADHVHKWAWRA